MHGVCVSTLRVLERNGQSIPAWRHNKIPGGRTVPQKLEGWLTRMGYAGLDKPDSPTEEVPATMSNEAFLVRAAIAGLTGAANALHQFLSSETPKVVAVPAVVEPATAPEAPAEAPKPASRGRGRPPKDAPAPAPAAAAPEPELDPLEPEDDPLAEAPAPQAEPAKPEVTKQLVTQKLIALRDADKAAGKPARERVDQIIKKVAAEGAPLVIDSIPVTRYADVVAVVDKLMSKS
jgi:hypothetical protein